MMMKVKIRSQNNERRIPVGACRVYVYLPSSVNEVRMYDRSVSICGIGMVGVVFRFLSVTPICRKR